MNQYPMEKTGATPMFIGNLCRCIALYKAQIYNKCLFQVWKRFASHKAPVYDSYIHLDVISSLWKMMSSKLVSPNCKETLPQPRLAVAVNAESSLAFQAV